MQSVKLKQCIADSVRRSLVSLVRRPMFFMMMVVMPLLCSWMLLDMMSAGSPTHVPVAVVDLDNSSISRRVVRSLDAMSAVDVKQHLASYAQAEDAVRRGQILGFIYIPKGLEQRAISGQQPTISYYINYAYYTPASFQYKAFETVTLKANGTIAKGVIDMVGLPAQSLATSISAVTTHVHGISNPWANYGYYLGLSFPPCLLALLVMLVTCFSIGTEIKYSTCRDWLSSAGDSIGLAVVCKLVPQTLLFTAAGWMLQFLMYRVYWLPLNCPPSHMLLAMPLFVMANQGFALAVMCFVPSFRLGTTVCSLLGMLSFSFCGFSLPIESMYPWVHSLGYVMPMRYYFLLSADQALNGLPFYFSRFYYAALLAYTLLPVPLIWRLRRVCVHPVYVP